jgi:hypothetical protein
MALKQQEHDISRSRNPYLVGGWALPLWKMMERKSVGMMTFPIYGKSETSCSKPPTSYSYKYSKPIVIQRFMFEFGTCVVSSRLMSQKGPFQKTGVALGRSQLQKNALVIGEAII